MIPRPTTNVLTLGHERKGGPSVPEPRLFTLSPTVTVSRAVQYENKFFGRESISQSITTEEMPVQPLKAESPREVICGPSCNPPLIPVQPSKAEEPIDWMPESGKEESDEHPENAELPILVTEAGNETDEREAHFLNIDEGIDEIAA